MIPAAGTIIYVLSVGLQIAGALLLILKYWMGSTRRQLINLRQKRTRVENSILYSSDYAPSDSEFVEEAWLSRIAFLYIAIGYVIGIWGSVGDYDKLVICITVIVMAAVLMAVGKSIAVRAGKNVGKERTD